MRGFNVAVFMLCIALSFSTLGTMGWFAWAGMDPGTGGFEEGSQEAESDLLQFEPGLPWGEGQVGDFSLVTAGLDIMSTFWTVIVHSRPLFVAWGLPPDIALALNIMITTSFVLAFGYFIRGVRGR